MHELVFDGRLHLAPITSDPQDVLDVGTGRGDWAIDFAEYGFLVRNAFQESSTNHACAHRKYPSARVIGTDLSPIQPLWYALIVHRTMPPLVKTDRTE